MIENAVINIYSGDSWIGDEILFLASNDISSIKYDAEVYPVSKDDATETATDIIYRALKQTKFTQVEELEKCVVSMMKAFELTFNKTLENSM